MIKPHPLQYSHAFIAFILLWCFKLYRESSKEEQFVFYNFENVPHNSMINCIFRWGPAIFQWPHVSRCCGFSRFPKQKKTIITERAVNGICNVDWKNWNENRSAHCAYNNELINWWSRAACIHEPWNLSCASCYVNFYFKKSPKNFIVYIIKFKSWQTCRCISWIEKLKKLLHSSTSILIERCLSVMPRDKSVTWTNVTELTHKLMS